MTSALMLMLMLVLAMVGGGAPLGAAEPTEAEVLGTWRGTITPPNGTDALDGGIIVISRGTNGMTATVGPNERARFPANRLAMTEHGLRFEVSLEGPETRLLVYDLAIAEGAMTGTVTLVRYGLTEPSLLSFSRQ